MTQAGGQEQPSVGTMLSDVATDVTRLLSQEVALARAEIRAEATKAVRGARAAVNGAAALWLAATLASVGGVVALSDVLASSVPALARWSTPVTAGAIAVAWLVVGLGLLRTGRRRLRRLSPIPRETIASLKEDMAWLRIPSGYDRRSRPPGPS